MKPEGGTADASRKFAAGLAMRGGAGASRRAAAAEAQAESCGNKRREPKVAQPAELKDDARCESGVIAGLAGGRAPTQVGRPAASRPEARSRR